MYLDSLFIVIWPVMMVSRNTGNKREMVSPKLGIIGVEFIPFIPDMDGDLSIAVRLARNFSTDDGVSQKLTEFASSLGGLS